MARDVLARAPRGRRLAWRTMLGLVRILPLDAARAVAWMVGSLLWFADARGRRVVAGNLVPLIPPACPEAVRRAARRSYRLFAVSVAEALALDRLPARALGERRLRLVDPWGVFRTRPLRGPAILITVHANWELMLAATRRLGLVKQVETVARDEGDPWLAALRARLRAAVGCRAVGMDRAPLAALRAIRDGRILGLVADRDYAGSGRVVPVLGRPLRLPLGPAALAAQTGAPIVPMLLARRGWRSFDLIVARPIAARPGGDLPGETLRLLHATAEALGRFLAAAPAQWVAFHPAWAAGGTASAASGRAASLGRTRA